MPTSSRKRRRSPLGSLIELVVTVAVAIGLAILIQAFIVKPYRIPSPSMVPTLDPGQRVLANRLVNHPSVGDIVVFHPPHGADFDTPVCGNTDQGAGHPQACGEPTAQESSQTFIKRVIAGPGDRVDIVGGHAYVNGRRKNEPYINHAVSCTDPTSCNFPKPITVPAGEYFMMGDNRAVSDDSRFWGPVPEKWIIGVAFFTYWPPDRIGTL